MSESKEPVIFKSFEPEHTTEQARAHFSSLLGEQVETMERLNKGEANVVYDLTTPTGEYIAKVSPKTRGWQRFAVEAWAYDQCREVGVPTPEVVALDVSQGVFPEAYLLMKKLPGADGASLSLSPEERLGYAQQLGEIYRKIHSIKLHGVGTLVPDGDSYRGEHDTQHSRLLHKLTTGGPSQSTGSKYEPVLTAVQEFIIQHQDLLSLPPGTASLIHYDLSTSLKNVLMENGRIVGVVDLENARAGDPAEEFAYADFWAKGDKATLAALRKGYSELVDDERTFQLKLALYELTLALTLIPYYLDRQEKLGQPQKQLGFIDERIPQLLTGLRA